MTMIESHYGTGLEVTHQLIAEQHFAVVRVLGDPPHDQIQALVWLSADDVAALTEAMRKALKGDGV
jgi:hypothetical protein